MRVAQGDQVLDGLNTGKLQELLAYLLLHRQHLHRREALADLFWDKCNTSQSLKYLRQALWQLQLALGNGQDAEETALLQVETEWVALNAGADLWLDVVVFEAASDRVRDIQGRELDADSVGLLQEATGLYQDDLLPGWYQDWCVYERQRLQNLYLIMLDKLMDYCEAHQEYEAGLGYGSQILKYDRARERTHRRLMRLSYLAGDRTAALRQYKSCVAALTEELDVGPAKSTIALYEQIRADHLDDAASLPPMFTSAIDSSSPLSEILDRLKQLQATLVHTHRQIQQEIQQVEQSLSSQS
jgi:DNA-binding SARP family transcriptional activator